MSISPLVFQKNNKEIAKSSDTSDLTTTQLILNTLVAEIALVKLPSEVKTVSPELTIEVTELPFFENKYGISSHRTYRTVVIRFSEPSQELETNINLMNTLKKLERVGLSVPSEKLLKLKENMIDEWEAHCEGVDFKLMINPRQQKLSSLAPSLIHNLPFDEALQLSLQDMNT